MKSKQEALELTPKPPHEKIIDRIANIDRTVEMLEERSRQRDVLLGIAGLKLKAIAKQLDEFEAMIRKFEGPNLDNPGKNEPNPAFEPDINQSGAFGDWDMINEIMGHDPRTAPKTGKGPDYGI